MAGVNLAGIIVACSKSYTLSLPVPDRKSYFVDILYLRTAAIWGWSKRALSCVVITNMVGMNLALHHKIINSYNWRRRSSSPLLFMAFSLISIQ